MALMEAQMLKSSIVCMQDSLVRPNADIRKEGILNVLGVFYLF